VADKTIGVHTDDFFNHVGFKTGASLFSELGIIRVPTKISIPSAPTLDSLAAPGDSSGVLQATATLPTTNTDGSALVRAEIEDIALHYKISAGVTTADPFVIFSTRETLPWLPGDLSTWYVKVRVRDTHGNWSALSNELSGAAIAPSPETAGLWAHRLGSASVFTDNSPGAGEAAWSNVILYWKDTKYTITAGDTDKKYIWWDYSLSTTTFQVTDSLPTLEQADVIVGYNDNGTWKLMVYAPTIMADYVRAGNLQSSNWASDAGSQFDLDAGTVKLGGSSDPHFSVDASGNLISKSGTIAGFTIDDAEGLYAGSAATRVQMKPGAGFWAGATAFGSAPFRVSQAGVLVATNATITGTITANAGTIGGFTVSSSEGLYAGSDATRVQMKAGVGIWTGATAYGSAPFYVSVAGALTAKSGVIGGFTLSATSLTAGSGGTAVGLLPGSYPFFAGNATPASAPFRVSNAGALVASSATITGTITATAGTIGGFTVDSTEGLYAGSGATRIQLKVGTGLWLGATAYGSAPFRVSPAGALVATSATIAGSITATAGTIAGFTVDSTEGLYAGTGITRVQMKAGFGFWAGATAIGDAPFRATQAGVVTCSNITITGGTIGGFTPDAVEGIYVGTGATRVQMKPGVGIWCGATAIGDAPFRVTNAGALTATGVTIAGAITASSGTIGGFTVDSTDGLYAGTGATRVQMKPGAGFWAGATTIGDAPFKVTNAGALTSTSGAIGGWALGATTLTGGDLTLDAGNTKITAGTGNDIIVIDAADADYRLVIGNAVYASAPFSVQKDGSFYLGGVAGNLQWSPSPAALVVTATYASAAAGSARITINDTVAHLEAMDASNTRVDIHSDDITLFDATPTLIAYIPTTTGVTHDTNPYFVHNQVSIDNKLVVGSAAIDNPSEALYVVGSQRLTGSLDVDTDLNVDGYIEVGDHSTPTSARVVGIVYGTGSPPAASSTPIGSLWVKYVA